MTQSDSELLELATPYALDAVSVDERADIDRRLAAAPAAVVEAFHAEVRQVRESMAALSAVTAIEPPARLRSQVLAAVGDRNGQRTSRWTTVFAAAAAALVVGLGAVAVGVAMWPAEQPSTAEEIFAAPDVQTTTGELPSGGSATVIYSPARHAGVLVMNDVPPPPPGSVYQMWLVGDREPRSAGTMTADDIAPSTTAVLTDLGDSSALAFTVEPGTGSVRPTGEVFAELPLRSGGG
ncbi:anti-sigma factor [Mycolicibacterium thermoresistibile]